jgi:hypothetical protein
MDGILKASYGDKKQRELNRKCADPKRGHQIYEKFKSDQQGQLRPEVRPSPHLLACRHVRHVRHTHLHRPGSKALRRSEPPTLLGREAARCVDWSQHAVHALAATHALLWVAGQPYGGPGAQAAPNNRRSPSRVSCPATHGCTSTHLRFPCPCSMHVCSSLAQVSPPPCMSALLQMEVSPGILVDVGPGMPRPAGPTKPYQVATQQLQPAVCKLEEAMRAQLRKRSAVHAVDKTILLKAFGKVGASCCFTCCFTDNT